MSINLNFPFTTPGNYDFDSDKIELDAGKSKLKLQQADVDFTEDFSDDIDDIYDSDLAEFKDGLVRQKSQVNALSGANFNTDINLEDWSGGVKTGTTYNGAGITSGKLDLSGNLNKYIDFDADLNADSQQTGCIRFKWTPKYTGAGSFQYLFTIVQGVGNANNRIRMYHQSTLLFWVVSDSSGVAVVSQAETFSPVADTEYEIELNWDITTGVTRVFIDGVQLGTTNTGTGTRDSNIGLLRLGKDLNGNGNADFLIDDLIIFDTVQHTSNYTKGYNVSDYKYSETSIVLPEMAHTGDGTIKLFNSLTTTYAGSPRILLEIGRSGNKLYWNGIAWVVSDETYDQATDPVTFNTNCPTLDVNGEKYGQFTIVFPDSNTLSSVSDLTANMNVDIGYPTTNPTIKTNTSFKSDGLINFVETATKAGSDQLKYTLLKNSTEYWNNAGTWEESDGTYSQSNLASEILTYIDDFLTDGYGYNIKIKAFLHSDDGTSTPYLDNILIYYDFSGEDYTLTEVIIYGNNLTIDGESLVEYLTVKPIYNVYGETTIIRNSEVAITINDNGYWEAKLYIEDVEPDYLLWNFGGKKIKTNFLTGTRKFSELTIQ